MPYYNAVAEEPAIASGQAAMERTATEEDTVGDGSASAVRPTKSLVVPLRLLGRSLRAKLILLSLLLVVVPGAVFAGIAIGGARRALEHAVGRQLAEVAQDTAERVESELDRVVGAVRALSLQPPLREFLSGGRNGRISALLASLAASDGQLVAVSAVDARARTFASSDPARLGELLSDRAWWSTVERGRVAITLRDAARSTGGALEVVAPIFDAERPSLVIGAVVADYPWEQMNGSLQHLQYDLAALGLDVTVLVVDGEGRVVGGGWWEEPSELSGKNLRALGWSAPDLGQTAPRPSYLHEGVAEALVGYASITTPGLGMAALVVQPLADALAPVRALRQSLLVTLAGVLLGGLALAVLIADRLSQPIRELTAATRELARTGEPPAPVPVRTHDEIGELSASFNRMAADLLHARDDLLSAAKFAFVGELAAGMAHEIRTPLGILRSSAQILGRSLPQDDQRCTELVDMIVSEVDRLERVVAGLLELARPHRPEVESAALTPVLHRAVDFVTTQASERGISLYRDLSPLQPPARCDPEQIYQVALNLLINALQNVPRGGRIEVRSVTGGDGVGFEVKDDGPGIPRELHERIFAPFFTRRPGGTGLGLAMVQRIVQTHHGSIAVASEPGHGATFRVLLPSAERKGQAA